MPSSAEETDYISVLMVSVCFCCKLIPAGFAHPKGVSNFPMQDLKVWKVLRHKLLLVQRIAIQWHGVESLSEEQSSQWKYL